MDIQSNLYLFFPAWRSQEQAIPPKWGTLCQGRLWWMPWIFPQSLTWLVSYSFGLQEPFSLLLDFSQIKLVNGVLFRQSHKRQRWSGASYFTILLTSLPWPFLCFLKWNPKYCFLGLWQHSIFPVTILFLNYFFPVKISSQLY